MKKSVGALLLFLSLCIGLPVQGIAVEYGAEVNPEEKVYQQTFTDVPTTHWAFRFIAELVERGAISGYPDGKFYPDKTVTREEFAKIMVAAAGLTAVPAQASSYADVPLTYWSSPFVETAKPYMTAYQNGGQLYFKPTAGALREDMAVAVVRLKGYDARLADLSMIRTMFSDVSAISTEAQPYVALAVENGIISGYDDGTFRGQATITRAEAAAILWRAFQYGNDTKVIPGEIESVAPAPTSAPTPKPTPKPTPIPKPAETMPPEPEKEIKPFVAETLTRADISDTTLYVAMDDDNNLIYYDEGEQAILSLDPDSGEVETLVEVAGTTYTDADGLIYEGLTVNQVFWDDVASRLLVDGTFQTAKGEGGWESGSGNKAYSEIFALEDGNLEKVFDRPKYIGEDIYDDGQKYDRLCLAMENGEYVCRVMKDGHSSAYICDLSRGISFETENKHEGKNINTKVEKETKFGRNDKMIYSTLDGYLCQYNYGTNEWARVNDVFCNGFYCGAADYQNSCFYTWETWGTTAIQILRPSDGAHQTKLNPAEDVEILDMRPLPTTPDNLYVTTDEQYLFYDSSAKAIRVIRVNPEAY